MSPCFWKCVVGVFKLVLSPLVEVRSTQSSNALWRSVEAHYGKLRGGIGLALLFASSGSQALG